MLNRCEEVRLRRFLLIGGPAEVQERLRELMQGSKIDFRLISAEDQIAEARITSRVEGCDLLLLWAEQGARSALSRAYEDAALTLSCPVLILSDHFKDRAQVGAICRAILRRASRGLP